MKVLLDTNAYTYFKGGDAAIFAELAQSQTIYLPVVVIGELYVGFRNGSKLKENKEQLERFLEQSMVETINITLDTALIFSEIRHYLQKKGKPISINDVWIAASVIETGSLLITYDKDFLHIPGLRVWDMLKN